MSGRLTLPEQAWVIWVTALTLPVNLMIVTFFYFDRLLASGDLDPRADSVGIPMIGIWSLALIATPFVVLITWACLRNFRGGVALSFWAPERPFFSALIGLFFSVPAVLLIGDILVRILLLTAWYEHLWDLTAAHGIALAAMLRAAATAQLRSSIENSEIVG